MGRLSITVIVEAQESVLRHDRKAVAPMDDSQEGRQMFGVT